MGVGCQAPGREHADRRPLQRLTGQGSGADRARHGRAIPDGDGGFAGMRTSRSGTRGWRSRPSSRTSRRSSRRNGQAGREEAGQGAHQGQHVGVLEAHQAVDGEVRIVAEPPLIVPARRPRAGQRARGAVRVAARDDARAIAQARNMIAACCWRGFELDRLRAQGGRGRKRRDPRVDRAAARARRPGPTVSADEGGRGLGARGVRRPERVQKPRRAGRHRTATDAGQQRHLPRLAARQLGTGRRRRATSTSAS